MGKYIVVITGTYHATVAFLGIVRLNQITTVKP